MSGTVNYEKYQDIALLNIQNPPVNALSSGVRQGLYQGLETAFNDATIKAIILYSEGKIFISGADISEFGNPMESPILIDVLDYMEHSPKPIIAAINGTAFGGGLETALCCDYRIAIHHAQLGLPEVKLGLLPGAGGTQRLPRLIGLEKAMMMILSGEPVSGSQAHQTGLIDRVVENNLLDHAKQYARELISKGAHLNKVSKKSVDLKTDNLNTLIEKANLWIKTHRYKQFAPTMIIKCMTLAATANSLKDGLKGERECFLKCLEHPQRSAMIHGFFSERQANKHPNINKHTKTTLIKSIAVLGAGTMGQGIATALLLNHYHVQVIDTDSNALSRLKKHLHDNFAKKQAKHQLTSMQAEAFLSNIQFSTTLQDIANCDLVIESIIEDTKIKNTLFQTLDNICAKKTLFVSNTSSLNLNEMFSAVSRSNQVAGLHFFNPAEKTRLIELIPAEHTNPETLASLQRLTKSLNKVSVFCENAPGFIVNRMLADLLDACLNLVINGTPFETIDQVLTQFGLAIGPFKTCDLVGLDIVTKVHQELIGSNASGTLLLEKITQDSGLGRKTQQGFYTYTSLPVTASPNAISACNSFNQTEKTNEPMIDEQDILDYCIAILANSGGKLLHSKIAYKSSDIDIASIYGFGFPVFTGGIMHHASNFGWSNIIQILEKNYNKGRINYQPCQFLHDQLKQDNTH